VANCIDMTEHHVSAQTIAKRHWSLEIDNISCMQRAKVCTQVCFFAYIGIPPSGSIGGHNSEATAIDRN
jgi:hypothetical protein